MPNVPYISAVEAKGWSLYDITDPMARAATWETHEVQGPATTVEDLGTFLFAPQPQDGQTLRAAYDAVGGLGPCLRISNPNDPAYKTLEQGYSPKFAVCSRFILTATELTLLVPLGPKIPRSDLVRLRVPGAQEVFERNFDIISSMEFLREYNAHRARYKRS